MTQINIMASITEVEAGVLAFACNRLTDAMSNKAIGVAFNRAATLDDVVSAPNGTIRVVSLGAQLASTFNWVEEELSLRRVFSALAETGDPVLVATIFRYVPAADDSDGRLLTRVRRLNLLAAELSREYGAFVVDFDRVLADVGGLALGCDYRLEGQKGLEMAGQALALGIAGNALDAYLPFEVQERMVSHLLTRSENVAPAPELIPANMMSMGIGRRRQRVSTITAEVQEDHVGWLVGQVVHGKVGLGEASQRLLMAVRRRGARESFGLLTSGLIRLMGRRGTA
jgi:hypothetical protein